MRNELLKYIKRNRTIKIIYMSDSGKTTKRTVRVLKINSNTFTAYCYLRGAKRTFKINNVLAVVPVKERAVI